MRQIVLGVLVLVCLQWPGHATAQPIEASRVKAAYLYNFAKFVEWPSAAFAGPDDPAVICIARDDRTAKVLQAAVSGKRANGRPVESRTPRSSAEFKTCNVLFIGSSNKSRIVAMLEQLRGSSTLTVGQSDQFISLGGIKNGTIELKISPGASNAAGLKISSRLLVMARVIKTTERPGGDR